jgi:hypothetical protein
VSATVEALAGGLASGGQAGQAGQAPGARRRTHFPSQLGGAFLCYLSLTSAVWCAWLCREAPLTADLLAQMKYTKQVALEVLRFRPPAPMVPHIAAVAYPLTPAYTVPKGTIVFPSVFEASHQVTHNSPSQRPAGRPATPLAFHGSLDAQWSFQSPHPIGLCDAPPCRPALLLYPPRCRPCGAPAVPVLCAAPSHPPPSAVGLHRPAPL